MSRLNTLYRWAALPLLLSMIWLLTGCAVASGEQTTTVTTLPAVTPAVTAEVAATVEVETAPATPEPTPAGPRELVIWWPEPLAPLDNEVAAEILSEQLSAFQRETNEEIAVEFRLKRVGSVGGIMPTLRTASAVAPGALPDLTLMQRNDLLIAVQNGLIHPLDPAQFPAILEDLSDVGVALGTAGGTLYGLPYTLTVSHMVYAPVDDNRIESWRFADLLADETPFRFPAARTNSISDMLLLQYIAAGGSLLDIAENNINAAALFDTFAFYDQAVATGMIDPLVLEYTTPFDYFDDWLTNTPQTPALLTSTMYLSLADTGATFTVGPIPSSSGEAMGVVDGWMWVLTTPDAERQARALRVLNWMLNAGRQSRYTRAIHMLPSQRTALRQLSDSSYATFIDTILDESILSLSESESGSTVRVIQTAFEDVIAGVRSADEATQDVLLQLEN